jgi:hypothetical protein
MKSQAISHVRMALQSNVLETVSASIIRVVVMNGMTAHMQNSVHLFAVKASNLML